ncbi:MAG: tetratricopeptide repeat protein [Sandaracinaceae bacterium]|nr:hypothetical protein [Myxococcales bacterium]
MSNRISSLAFAIVLWLPAAGLAQEPSGEGPPDEQGASAATPPVSESEARSLFEAGQSAFRDGRFEDALARWQSAYDLARYPELLYNIATALDRLGRMDEAARRYRDFLEENPEAANRNYVQRRVEVIETHLAQQARHEEAEPIPELELPDAEDDGPSGDTPASEAGPPAGPIVIFSVAGAALAAGIVTAVLANDQYESLDASCPAGACRQDAEGEIELLRTLGLTTDVLFGVAAASAVAALVWLLADEASGEAPVQAGATCATTGCVATVRARF